MTKPSSERKPPMVTPTVIEKLRAAGCDASAGATAGILSELLFYGIDSYKVMKQAGEKVSVRRLFSGAIPVAVTGSGPSFFVFFGFYNELKYACSLGMGDSTAAFIAAVCAGVPSSLVAVPSDVIKKRIMILKETPSLAVKNVVAERGLAGFFTGWRANLLKDVPFAAVKMSLYEGLARLYLSVFAPERKAQSNRVGSGGELLKKGEAGIVGLGSGVITAVMTCPLDCINTRMKSGELAEGSLIAAGSEIVRKDGASALFRGLLPRTFIIGLGSTVFFYWYGMFRELWGMGYLLPHKEAEFEGKELN